jgi:hypothetical protein
MSICPPITPLKTWIGWSNYKISGCDSPDNESDDPKSILIVKNYTIARFGRRQYRILGVDRLYFQQSC